MSSFPSYLASAQSFAAQCGGTAANNFWKKLKNAYCAAVPNGRTVGVGGSAGSVVGITGTVEQVRNWDTGQVNFFASGGPQGGLVGLGGSVFAGPVWGAQCGKHELQEWVNHIFGERRDSWGSCIIQQSGTQQYLRITQPTEPLSASFVNG